MHIISLLSIAILVAETRCQEEEIISDPIFGRWSCDLSTEEKCSGKLKSRCAETCGCCSNEILYLPCDHANTNGEHWQEDGTCNSCNGDTYKGPYDCECRDERYGVCCDYDCLIPEYCKDQWCTTLKDYMCLQCHNNTANNQAYFLNSEGRCLPKCNWLGHWCFPGTCNEDGNYLHTTCQCTEGFKISTPNDETTNCVLDHDPEILTCRSAAESEHGELAETPFLTNSTHCDSVGDAFVNFVPTHLLFQFDFVFELPEDPPGIGDDGTHPYVNGFAFGIVKSSVEVIKYYSDGGNTSVTTIDLPNSDSNCTVAEIDRTNPVQQSVTCYFKDEYTSFSDLDDGEKVCQKFKAVASGFVIIEDLSFPGTLERHDEYGDTIAVSEKCFVTDLTDPDHCANTDPPCESDVLNFGSRIRSGDTLLVRFDGWFDPKPDSDVAGASGMKEYDIELREIIWTPKSISADFKSIQTYKSNGMPVIIQLEDRGQPSMYAIYLWALDNTQESSNYRIARRFVLVDNTSQVEIDSENPIIPTKASKESGLKWQVEITPIKLDWTSHFFNTWHRHTNYLLPITSDGNVTGVFEQETGELPVEGTPNVDGVINFMYAFQITRPSVNDTQGFTQVPDPLEERLTLEHLQIVDGDTVNIVLKAIDIMNNTNIDNITLYIDSSNPESEMLGLTKDGHQLIYAHNSSDLSKMNMTFKAFDVHSGLKQVKWILGTKPGLSDVGHGALPVVKLQDNDTCGGLGNCYCPSIGFCQLLHFDVPLEGLVANSTHEADHNREYFFVFEIINEAHLISYDEFAILIDVSPPEEGYVFDGPPDTTDRDFQGDELFSWHWTGFIDHESGILKYKYAIGKRCFSQGEILDLQFNISDIVLIGETTDTFINYILNDTGLYYISVIAFNGAMEPAESVCSNGIVFDVTPPEILEISFTPASFPKSIICGMNETAWFLDVNGQTQQLVSVQDCKSKCLHVNTTNDRLFVHNIFNDTVLIFDNSTSSDICSTFPVFSLDTPIYLPSPHFELNWKVLEAESQMLDYVIGISEDPESSQMFNVKGYHNTHNRTHFKCVQCGLGQGDIVYIIIRALNKAGLEDKVSIGPVIVDMTPPVYNSGILVNINDTDVISSWEFDSFIDPEEDFVLSNYEWCLGTRSNPTEVQTWTNRIFPFDFVDEFARFYISFPKAELQLHDQGKGSQYRFSIKSYNTARHYVVTTSDDFSVGSNSKLSGGIIYHVNHNHSVVEYQQDLDYLCASWIGFSQMEIPSTLHIGVGTQPFKDNISPLQEINNMGSYCFEQIQLVSVERYYFYMVLTDGYSNTEATSNGIFVATRADTYSQAKVDNGPDCSASERVKYLLTNNITLSNDSDPYENKFQVNLTGWMIYTFEVEIDSNDCEQCLSIFINDQELSLVSWKYNQKAKLYYVWEMQSTYNKLNIYNNIENSLVISSIAIYQCILDKSAQLSQSELSAHWNLKNIEKEVSHYEVAFYQQQCQKRSCIKIPIANYKSVKRETSIIYPYTMREGEVYQTYVKPCFTSQCLDPVLSRNLLVDLNSPIERMISAHMLHHSAGQQLYSLEAKWEPFLQRTSDGYDDISLYDWSITLDSMGNAHIVPWTRIWKEEMHDEIVVNTSVILPVHRDKLMYFTLRCQGISGKMVVKTTPIEIINELSSAVPQVFDLPGDMPLDPLKDFLHSQNLGPRAQELYALEVDFSSDPDRISGAILGVECGSYHWALQQNSHENCLQHPESSSCKALKETTDNVVEWKRLTLPANMIYFICVQPIGTTCEMFFVCSNGFIIDIHPPVSGHVEVGLGYPGVQSDTSMTAVYWTGFHDIEEEMTIPYSHGISYFKVAIGSSSGESDVSPYQNVGYTDHTIVHNIYMASGYLYFASVKACDHAGLCSESSSEGVLVDGTPPTAGHVKFYVNHIISQTQNKTLIVSYTGFEDKESGIVETLIGIGSTEDSLDIMSFKSTETNLFQVPHTELQMHDGNYYYAKVKAVNKVGLWSVAVSPRLLFDASPPQLGHVYLGKEGEVTSNGWYLIKNDHIQFFWNNFTDPHTGITFYRVAIGSIAAKADVLPWRDVGLTNEFHENIHLPVGRPLFISVEACNGALLCTTAHTPPVVIDKSPPLPGHIIVGNSEQHEHWHSSWSFLSVKWVGCIDHESGIHHNEWCIGTSNHSCDIVPYQNAHTASSVIKTDLNLPISTKLYVTIMAFNNAGYKTTFSSKHFIIDKSSPVIVSSPRILSHVHGRPNMIRDRSYVSLTWKFKDTESPIKQHSISLVSHHDGYIPLSNMLLGDISDVTIPLPTEARLEDGTNYQAVVTACNAAMLCTSAQSENILVDSSKPMVGDFAGGMIWRNAEDGTECDLIWQNFIDPHSPIYRYILTVSSAYNGHDLSDGEIEHFHDKKSVKQEVTVKLTETVEPNSLIVVSIIAQNQAGLFSDVLKRTVYMMVNDKDSGNGKPKTGPLEIEKHSCDIHYCTLDCTCAPLDQVCIPDIAPPDCVTHNATEGFIVYDGPQNEIKHFTPSSMCLDGHWFYHDAHPLSRFTWSVSQKDHSPGFGIFNTQKEKYWFDVELYNSSSYCMPGNRSFMHGESYVYHTRAWHSYEEFSHAISEGVLVDITPPNIRLSKNILDMDSKYQHEVHFTTDTSGIYSDWEGVFEDPESGLLHYEVSMGTTFGGNEIFGPNKVGLNTSLSYTEVTLTAGEHYYTTIHAFNTLGMVAYSTSKGFVIDLEKPISGSVYTNKLYQDKKYHHTSMIASWFGFVDKHSYIREYNYKVDTCNTTGTWRQYTSNGLAREVNIVLDSSLENTPLCLYVYATDAAGFDSDIVSSLPFYMDNTPPVLRQCTSFIYDHTYIMQCDCSEIIQGHHLHMCKCSTKLPILFQKTTIYKIQIIVAEDPGVEAQLELGPSIGRVHYERVGYRTLKYEVPFVSENDEKIKPVMYFQKSEEMVVQMVYNFSVSNCQETETINSGVTTSALRITQPDTNTLLAKFVAVDGESSIARIQFGVGTTPTGSQLMPLTDLSSSFTSSLHLDILHNLIVYPTLIVHNKAGLWSYFRGTGLKIDLTPPVVTNDEVSVDTSGYSFQVTAQWNVTEQDSTVTDCEWTIGLSEGASDILSYEQTQSLTSAQRDGLNLTHGEQVHVTIVCYNTIGLSAKVHASPVTVVVNGPEIEGAYSKMYPQQTTFYKSTGNMQSQEDSLEFSHHGLSNGEFSFVDHYEVKVGSSAEWTNIHKLDHIKIDGISFMTSEIPVAVRAVNTKGMCSNDLLNWLYINIESPSLTGDDIKWSQNGNTINLQWEDVFQWQSDQGTLSYEVFVGSVEGAADVLKALVTTETQISVTSAQFEESKKCSVAIHAISPAGLYQMKRQVISLP